MEFFQFLMQESEARAGRLLAVSALAGLAHGLLLTATVLAASASDSGPPSLQHLGLFVVALSLFVLSRKHLMDGAAARVEEAILKIRVRITARALRADLLGFEALGRASLPAVLTQDTYAMSEAARMVVGGLCSAILVAFAFLYIAVLSAPAFYAVALCVVAGVAIYLYESRKVERRLDGVMAEERRLLAGLDHLVGGFKELKMSAAKAADLLAEDVVAVAERTRGLKAEVARQVSGLVLFGPAFFYALMGVVIFALPALTEAPVPVVKIISVILFIIGPISEIVGALPAISKANVATRALRGLELDLQRLEGEPEETAARPAPPPFASLRCEGLCFRYPEEKGRVPFQVGPVDLALARGEIVFLVGGNGAGKSTLIKLLTGLYAPTAGRLLLDGAAVQRADLAAYRSRFSIILQDFHLFDRLLGHAAVDGRRVDELLSTLRIGAATGVGGDGRFTSTNLSTGQKKRLALLVADLEQRDVLVLDEWAADQDPESRRWFYRELLPALAARGKTILAATHDDHYFDVAHRVLKMSEGRLEHYRAGSAVGERIG